ncbi:sensor histidine kinase [Kineosporia succinea]|uniref:histidine kinase n=1 Tax=Kineosporia succinea TaxID=84632 RepID=A0ABT9P8K0_9ACTN|nr:HAMP domain-containing sensor histidine kinase [Kineosporia succinea]MDP9829030.1 two-component system sensor histidine kinase MtrB [Kineosporia succinea]
MTWRPWPRGLRTRLLAAFVLVTLLGAAASVWAGTRSAGRALVTSSQDQLVRGFSDQIGVVAPTLTYPPDQSALDRLRAAVGADTLVTYRDLRSGSGAGVDVVTDTLRQTVSTRNRMFSQRITAHGRPLLLLGTSIVVTAPDGTRTASGIEVFAVRDLSPVQHEVENLTRASIGAAALVIPLAVLLALLAAGSVLRPVRDLRDTARRLADGDLRARTAPAGADELAELTVTVNEMAESLQASITTMQRMQAEARRFAADVSHELRTPLSTLTAVMDVLSTVTDDLEPAVQESATLAITETHRLVRLVEDLMEVSRFDAGTAPLRIEDVELAGAVRDCLRARSWLDQVVLTVPEQLWVPVDRRRLDVILANLVANAFRHGRPPVLVSVLPAVAQVLITVVDHGPGLDDGVRDHVFDRFYKADAARSRSTGSGLGLAIALENARLHGGGLTAGRAETGGAQFVLRIPRNVRPS